MPKRTTLFTSESAREAGRKSGEARRAVAPTMKTLAEYVKQLVNTGADKDGKPMREGLAMALVINAVKDVRWYELMLKLLGEMPCDKLEISRPKTEMADEIERELKRFERQETGGA